MCVNTKFLVYAGKIREFFLKKLGDCESEVCGHTLNEVISDKHSYDDGIPLVFGYFV